MAQSATVLLTWFVVHSAAAFGTTIMTLTGRSALVPRAPLPRAADVVAPNRRQQVASISSLCAKRKGKGPGGPRIPGSGPPQNLLQQQREYQEYLKMREASGMPAFDLYVKGPNSPTWYPCGSLGGDEKSKQLVESWMGGLLSDMAKGALDKGVASSLGDKTDLAARVVEQYPQLKKFKNSLKFGYKVAYKGLVEKRPQAAKVTELTEDMTKSALDNLKSAFGM